MNDEWVTPQPLFDILSAEFHFSVDAFATKENTKCADYFTKEDSAFEHSWTNGVIWMKPPYSLIEESLHWAIRQTKLGGTVVALVPSRTNPPWWHELAMTAAEMRFIRKKVSFGGVKKGVPFTGHTILVFRPGHVGVPELSSQEQR